MTRNPCCGKRGPVVICNCPPGSGITEITSIGGTVAITDPNGPVVNLEVPPGECCFPPDRTMIVSKTLPADADPARWFTDINTASAAALAFAWPSGPVTDDNHAHVWVAEGDYSAQAVVLISGVDVTTMPAAVLGSQNVEAAQLIPVDSCTWTPGAGVNAPQVNGNERVKMIGFVCVGPGNTTLTVDASAKPADTTAQLEFGGNNEHGSHITGPGAAGGALTVILDGRFNGTLLVDGGNVAVHGRANSRFAAWTLRGSVAVVAPYCEHGAVDGRPASGGVLDFADGPSIYMDWSDFGDQPVRLYGGAYGEVRHCKQINALLAQGAGPFGGCTIKADHSEINDLLARAIDGHQAPGFGPQITARWARINIAAQAWGATTAPDSNTSTVDVSWSRVGAAVVAGRLLGPDGPGILIARHAEIGGTARLLFGELHIDEATIAGGVEDGVFPASGGTLTMENAIVGGADLANVTINSPTNTFVRARNSTIHGTVHHVGAGGDLDFTDANITGDFINDSVNVDLINGATIDGGVFNTAAGGLLFKGGYATVLSNTGTGIVFAQGTTIASPGDNVATGTGPVRRRQTGVTGPLPGPATAILFAGAPFVAGTDYRVLLTQTGVLAGVAPTVSAQLADRFTINIPLGIGETFAYEIIPI